jgi:hypothetical protein
MLLANYLFVQNPGIGKESTHQTPELESAHQIVRAASDPREIGLERNGRAECGRTPHPAADGTNRRHILMEAVFAIIAVIRNPSRCSWILQAIIVGGIEGRHKELAFSANRKRAIRPLAGR